MTREQFKLLPAERVADIVWSLAEAHGELAGIIRGLEDLDHGSYASLRLSKADRERWDYGGARRSSYLRYGSLAREGAVLVALELVTLHPQKAQVRDLLVTRLDELVNQLIDAILEDIDRMSAVA